MKVFTLSLLALAALALTGCVNPANPPATYGNSPGRGLGSHLDTNPIAGGSEVLETRQQFGVGAYSAFNALTGEWDPRAVLTIIYFGFDKYNVGAEERSKLDVVAAGNPGARLIAAGYTDHFGTDQYNHGLSDRRAHSVKNYLTGLGISDANIEIQAFGKQYAQPGGSHVAVAKDRRVVVVNGNFKP